MKPFSATEIGTGRGCLRKHAFKYASDIPRPPQKASAATGTAGHALIEGYLKDGTVPPPDGLGALVRSGLQYLPRPGNGAVEASFSCELNGIPFRGFMDWTGPSLFVPGMPGDGWAVLDHKFMKDPARYGILTDDKALDDPQWILYRLAPTDFVPGLDPDRVYTRWNYFPTGTGRKRVKPANHAISYRQARGAFERVILPVIDAVAPWRGSKVDPLTVPPNPGHCDAYGGCEYRALGHCNVTAAESAAHLFGGLDMGKSIWDDLPGLNGAGQAPAATPATTPAAPAAEAAPFVFRFPGAPAPAPAPAPPEPTPSLVNPAVAFAAKPAAAPAPKAVQADAQAVTVVSTDPLARIGHALIAAGRVLVGS